MAAVGTHTPGSSPGDPLKSTIMGSHPSRRRLTFFTGAGSQVVGAFAPLSGFSSYPLDGALCLGRPLRFAEPSQGKSSFGGDLARVSLPPQTPPATDAYRNFRGRIRHSGLQVPGLRGVPVRGVEVAAFWAFA